MDERTRLASVRQLPRVLLGVLLAGALLLLGRVAGVLPLWYDEHLTVRLADLPSITDIWRALAAGFDFNPPLNYILTRWARHLAVASDPLAGRLPALAGLALLVTGLFATLERRIGSWYALGAVAPVLLTSVAVQYSTDARPYMLLAGVAAWALHFRQRAGVRDGRLAWPSALGLAVCTGAALLLHVWGTLLLAVLVAGELVIAARERRVRIGPASALAAAAPLTAIYVPLVRASRGLVFDNEVYAPGLNKLAEVLASGRPPVRYLLPLVLATAAAGYLTSRRQAHAPRTGTLALDEWVVGALLVASPLVPWTLAVVTGGVFMPRYGCLAIVGGVLLGGGLLNWIGRRREAAGAAAAVVALLSAAVYLPNRLAGSIPSEPASIRSLRSAADLLEPDVPILLVNPTDILPFDHGADDAWLPRVFYVADEGLAVEYTGTNAIDLSYIRGEPYLGMRLARFTRHDIARASRLYLLGRSQALTWLPQYLEDNGWTITDVGGLPTSPIRLAVRQPDLPAPPPESSRSPQATAAPSALETPAAP